MPRRRLIGLHVGGKQKMCRSGGAELLVLDGSAFIGSHSPVSRSLPSSNYSSVSPWPVTDHRAHTPTTTPFQCAGRVEDFTSRTILVPDLLVVSREGRR